jgi:hypothetical protein
MWKRYEATGKTAGERANATGFGGAVLSARSEGPEAFRMKRLAPEPKNVYSRRPVTIPPTSPAVQSIPGITASGASSMITKAASARWSAAGR